MAEKTLLEEIQEDIKNPKPVELTSTKSKKRRGTIKKLIVLCILLAIVVAEIILLLWSGWLWSQANVLDIQSPVTIQSPLTWHEKVTNNDIVFAKAEQIPEKTKLEMIYGGGYGEIVHKIHTLETTNGNAESGHHKDCERLGKTNEFGYFKGGNRSFCFDTFEESVKEVSEWFKLNLEDKPLPVAICYYNTGQLMSDCTYLQHYRSL